MSSIVFKITIIMIVIIILSNCQNPVKETHALTGFCQFELQRLIRRFTYIV